MMEISLKMLMAGSVNAGDGDGIRIEVRAGHSVALLGDTAAVGLEGGVTRLRVYEAGAGLSWVQQIALSEDDICPGGINIRTMTLKKHELWHYK